MMRLLYPLVASALITIAPFLLTFEKGQDIVRGLFGYSEFALLLLFALVKTSLLPKYKWAWGLLGVLFALMVVVAWADLQNLLAIKGWTTGWYGVLPFVTCAFAVAILWKTPGFSLPAVSFILFVSLVAHLAAYNYYAAQPLAQFPVVEYLARTAPKPVERKKLPEDFAVRYAAAIKSAGVDFNIAIAVTDSPSVTRDFVDTARSNVLVLVESWGIPMDPARFAEEIAVFKGIPMQVGVHHRMYSRTRTAEREDWIAFWTRDTSGRRDTTFLPGEFAKRGYATAFFFGGDSAEQWRYKYIRNIGFQNVVWGVENVAENAPALADSAMAAKVDAFLTGSVFAQNGTAERPVFLSWTTRDTKFPLPGFNDPYSGAADAVDSAYTVRLMGSLHLVADLARKYPNVRFIVQGDHDPILSPLAFQERFYKRWTPYVVLN